MPGSHSSASLQTLRRPTRSPLRSRGTIPREPSGPAPPPASHRPAGPARRPPTAPRPCHSLLRLSMELLLIPSPHGGFPFFFPTGDYSGQGEPPLQISTTVGTTSP